MPLATVEEVLRLYQEQYFDFNVRHFHEKLCEQHQIKLSYTWVTQALQGAGLVKPTKKRGVHRKRRPRRPLPGMYIPTATTAVNEMAESDTSLANNTGHFNLLITPALNSSHFNTKSVGGQTKLIQLVSRMGNRGRHIGVKPYSAESRP